MKWQKVALRDVSLGIYDGPHATPPECEKSGQYFLGIPHLSKDGRIDLSSPRYIADEDYPRWIKRVKPAYGDVVFSYEATLNLYAMIPRGLECCLGRRMGLVRPDAEKLDFRYLYYYFFSDEWRELVAAKTIVGATVDRLSIQDFPTYQISLPPLPIQRKIAEILGTYDDLIENNRRRIALLEKIARSIYRDWFVNFGHWGGECPSGIAKGELSDLVSRIGTGLNPRKNFILGHGENYYVTIKNMSDNTVVLDDKCAKVDDEAIARINRRSDLRAGDLLFSGIGTIGRVALIQETPRNWNTSESVFNLRPANDVPSEYLYCVLTADDVQAYAKSHALGVAQQGIRMADLKTCPVLVPSREILEKFASIVGPYLNLQYSLRQSVRNLALQRDRLLLRLLSGKLDVSKLVKEGV